MPVMRCSGLRVIVSTALVLSTSASWSAPQHPNSMLLYSDVTESGDVLGNRLVVLKLRGGEYVFLQEAQGQLFAPQVGTAVIDPKKDDFSFQITESDKLIATFKGKMTEKFVTGVFETKGVNGVTQTNFKLPRIVDRQQRFPDCK
jgi:hypothetical protein